MNAYEANGKENGYWCVICMRFLPSIDGVVIHDDIIHPDDMNFEETKQ